MTRGAKRGLLDERARGPSRGAGGEGWDRLHAGEALALRRRA